MSEDRSPADLALHSVGAEVIEELTRRVEDIDRAYRAVAEKMGQLYMQADVHRLSALTRRLDKPMRNASENEQAFAAILEELRLHAHPRPQEFR
jgi:hypothetical protein